MPIADTIEKLTAFERRVAGSEPERRAAQWLRDELASKPEPEPDPALQLEPFWCRPNRALAHAWHALLGLAGGLLTVTAPTAGGLIVLAALLSVLADAATGRSPGRLLTRERASQNVVKRGTGQDQKIRLIITANYDTGRMGLVYRDGPRRLATAIKALTGGRAPGWLAWLELTLGWLLIVAAARVNGSHGTAIGVVQLPPTIALVLAFALLVELATSPPSPGAADNASGVAVALALTRALGASKPAHLDVELVLTGCGEADGIGLRRHLKARRRELTPDNAIVLGIAPCAAGTPRWWQSDGPLLPLAYHSRLIALAAESAAEIPELGARPHRGRGSGQALPARLAGLPALTLGCLDGDDRVPNSRQPTDTPDRIDRAATDGLLELALMLVDAIDLEVGRLGEQRALTPA
jgi:hypothetical protein